MLHYKCRNDPYPESLEDRIPIRDHEVSWDSYVCNYQAKMIEASEYQGKPWTDPVIDFKHFNPKWNVSDGLVNRVSHIGIYEIIDEMPRNPIGRTGLGGRGLLPRWGPNHTADPIVTRWKIENNQKVINKETKLPILQFCAIRLKESGEWAIPSIMIDPAGVLSQTLKDEFIKEASHALQNTPEQIEFDKKMITNFFISGQEIYKGYVDDPRNTDNAWVETIAFNYHDDVGDAVGKFPLNEGKGFNKLKWIDINKDLSLYANHSDFIKKVVVVHHAHW